MVFISEVLPNPKGSDNGNEWIELANSENIPINISGWKLEDASGKIYSFKNNQIPAGGFFILEQKESKIFLNNSEEELKLLNPSGEPVDLFCYQSLVGEGVSVVKIDDKTYASDQPTPGKENKFEKDSLIEVSCESEEDFIVNFGQEKMSAEGEVIYSQNLSGTLVFSAIFICVILSLLFVFVVGKSREIKTPADGENN